MYLLFQAVDGIRYLVRSRGLGDVYKRQVQGMVGGLGIFLVNDRSLTDDVVLAGAAMRSVKAVSYTHLTLPTSDLV